MADEEGKFEGRVRFRNERGAYGFIERFGPGADVFVHLRDVDYGEIIEGSTVEFEIESSERGPRAKHVRVVDSI